ncbi:hypothetical protein DSO57_1020666 [Entomophthora muscae]|uniref:Uncharacterized protein n=1 Tax=Entomophthora muscae TaxID=34485 RepID=A0ACC2SGM5_9FUNG|nr:hypothetical protein DSO57_1020666 [Entomophthora muscae]
MAGDLYPSCQAHHAPEVVRPPTFIRPSPAVPQKPVWCWPAPTSLVRATSPANHPLN